MQKRVGGLTADAEFSIAPELLNEMVAELAAVKLNSDFVDTPETDIIDLFPIEPERAGMNAGEGADQFGLLLITE
jgi:hypothetical protein